MCVEEIEVVGVDNAREAYEVSQYLKGLPDVQDAKCDFLRNNLTIEYDESEMTRKEVLDEIEYSGCTPGERYSASLIDRLQKAVTGG